MSTHKIRPARLYEVYEFYCFECGAQLETNKDREVTCICGKQYVVTIPEVKARAKAAGILPVVPER